MKQPSMDLPTIPNARKEDVKTILNKVQLSSHFHNDSIHEDESDWVIGMPQDNSVALEPVLLESGKMPDVRGMGARDALYLLERKGIKVEVKGMGKVRKQSLTPGSPVRKYQTIQLELS
jgi:cell division protein FtsI (penicillin-binding protein 3)